MRSSGLSRRGRRSSRKRKVLWRDSRARPSVPPSRLRSRTYSARCGRSSVRSKVRSVSTPIWSRCGSILAPFSADLFHRPTAIQRGKAQSAATRGPADDSRRAHSDAYQPYPQRRQPQLLSSPYPPVAGPAPAFNPRSLPLRPPRPNSGLLPIGSHSNQQYAPRHHPQPLFSHPPPVVEQTSMVNGWSLPPQPGVSSLSSPRRVAHSFTSSGS